MIIDKIINKVLKRSTPSRPWLEYYNETSKSIKFTNKPIYEYLQYSVGDDLNYTALNYFGTKITYKELFKKVESVSKSLQALDVKPKDIISVCMPNTPEAIIMFYAINNIGCIADMIHPLSSPNQIKEYLNATGSNILLLIDMNYEKLKDIIPKTSVRKVIMASPNISMPKFTKVCYNLTKGLNIKKPPLSISYISWHEFIALGKNHELITVKKKSKDTAIILHSGGTTGTPKGIMISNFSFNALARQGGVNVYNVRPKDKIVTLLPIFHGFGLGVCTHCPLTLKVETILMPEFNAKTFARILKSERPQVIAGVPTLWKTMMENKIFRKIDLSSLKYAISGGDFLTLAMENRFNEYLRNHKSNIKVSKGYGMTESLAATSFTFDFSNEPASVGLPMIGNNFCICKPNTTKELGPNIEGEICVTGPTLMQGYFNNPKETKNVLKRHVDGRIWLHTGDLGYIKENGVIYFTQRLKRMIVSSGFNIYPSKIESIIETHKSVKSCCVIGIPHPYKMMVAKVFIVLKEDNQKEESKILKEIKALCLNNLETFSQPKYYEFVSDLPKTLYNKIDYRLLEEMEKAKTLKK